MYTMRFIRRYLAERFGERCSRCGWADRNVRTGQVMVEIEHIDGDWRNTNVENLTLLCPNCHALTPTFKALNRGNGRPDRHPHLRGKKVQVRQENARRLVEVFQGNQLTLLHPEPT